MPAFQFEAMDAQGQEIRDVIEAPTQDEAQATIRSMGYFVTKIAVQKETAAEAAKTPELRRELARGVWDMFFFLFLKDFFVAKKESFHRRRGKE